MLSINPLLVEESDISIQELESLSSVEKALFGDFILRSNDDFLTHQSAWGKTSETVLNTLRTVQENGVWIMWVDEKIKSFWILEKKKNKYFFDFFIANCPQKEELIIYLMGLFKRLDSLSDKHLYVNITNITNISRLVNSKFRISQSGDGRQLIRASYLKEVNCYAYENVEYIIDFYKNS